MIGALQLPPIPNDSLDHLRSVIKGDIVVPGDEDYPTAIVRWCATAERPAGLVVYVKDEEDILSVLEVALKHKTDIAVRGGGHCLAPASSSDGGIVIDLSRHMKGVYVDPEAQTVMVQGGAQWVDVDTETSKFGLACVGGTFSDVGVGGLTLGGGYGYLTGRHGLVIDNLLSARIVTGNLERIVASPTSNKDLFDAIRGGGGNFGVVSEFVFRGHEQRDPVWMGVASLPIPDEAESGQEGGSIADKVTRTVQTWYDEVGKATPDATVVYMFGHPFGTDNISLIMFYNGTAEEAENCFRIILDLPDPAVLAAKIKSRVVPYSIANNTIAPWGLGCYGKSSGIPRLPVGSDLSSICSEFLKLHHDTIYTHSFMVFQFTSNRRLLEAEGHQDMAFSTRSANISSGCTLLWKPDGDPVKARGQWEAAREQIKGLSQIYVAAQGLPYGNFETEVEGYDRAKIHFRDKYAKLQTVKAKHDPNLLFNKWFPIEPAAAKEIDGSA